MGHDRVSICQSEPPSESRSERISLTLTISAILHILRGDLRRCLIDLAIYGSQFSRVANEHASELLCLSVGRRRLKPLRGGSDLASESFSPSEHIVSDVLKVA